MLRLAASASLLAILSGAAIAADLPVYSPPPAPMLPSPPLTYNWSGFYIGAHGGWGFGSGDANGSVVEDGFVVGGQLGANYQFNQFVLGFEGDGSFVDWGAIEAIGTARLRAGFAFDRFLAYGTGGAAIGEEEVGWVAGGGAEYAVTDNFSAGIEYLHYEEEEAASDVIRGRVNVMFNSLFGQ
jgi:outer membrane immunogenic protein